MKVKTSELIDDALNGAVAKAEGLEVWREPDGIHLCEGGEVGPMFRPSTEWGQGGPIIEREGIELLCESLGFRWVASPQKGPEWRGPTPLIAAMRCFVASKLGDEIDVPDELQGE